MCGVQNETDSVECTRCIGMCMYEEIPTIWTAQGAALLLLASGTIIGLEANRVSVFFTRY